MPLPRAGCAAGILDGKLVVAGGTYWQDGRKIWSDRVDCFDPIANRWEPAAPMPQVQGDAASAAFGGALYVFGGGVDGPAVASAWSFRRGSWSPLPQMALPEPRRSAGAAVLDGRIYVLGGFAGTWTEFFPAASTFWAIEAGGSWRTLAPVPAPARFGSAVAAVGDRIFVAGGCTPENGGVRNLDEILSYDPHIDRWSVAGRLPAACRAASGAAVGDRLVVIGGYTDRFESRIVNFDPETGRVSDAGRLPHALADARFMRLGSGIIGATGENGVRMRSPWTLASG